MTSDEIIRQGMKAGLRSEQMPALVVNTHMKSQYLDQSKALRSAIAELLDQTLPGPLGAERGAVRMRESGTQQADLPPNEAGGVPSGR